MKARKVLEGATYDPKALKAICQAFDEAWARIADWYCYQEEEARLLLANSVFAVAPLHGLDVQALKDAALVHFALTVRGGRPGSVVDTGQLHRDSNGASTTADRPPKGGLVQRGEDPGQQRSQ